MERKGFFLTLEEVSAVIERFEDPALTSILQEIKPDPEMAFLINIEAMCDRYKVLPKDLLQEDAYYLRAFQSILRGKIKGMEAKGDSK